MKKAAHIADLKRKRRKNSAMKGKGINRKKRCALDEGDNLIVVVDDDESDDDVRIIDPPATVDPSTPDPLATAKPSTADLFPPVDPPVLVEPSAPAKPSTAAKPSGGWAAKFA